MYVLVFFSLSPSLHLSISFSIVFTLAVRALHPARTPAVSASELPDILWLGHAVRMLL